jgi:hypothetical protein
MPGFGAVLAAIGLARSALPAEAGVADVARGVDGDCCEHAAQAQAMAAVRIRVVRGMEGSRYWKARMMHRSATIFRCSACVVWYPGNTFRHSGRTHEVGEIRNLLSIVEKQQQIDSRHPWRSRYAPPTAFAFAILQTQSGSRTVKPVRAPE